MVEVESGVEDVLIDVEGSTKFVLTDVSSVDTCIRIICVDMYLSEGVSFGLFVQRNLLRYLQLSLTS